jgi:hypothetical protein
MELRSIKDTPDDILDVLTGMMNRDCQPGKYSLKELRDTYSKNTDILYIVKMNVPIYFLLLDVFPIQKMVYLHDICLNKLHRGKGIFKKSIAYLKKYYSKKGMLTFTLDASDSTKEEGLDQKARLHIFHSVGFYVNPETGLFKKSGEYDVIKTHVRLDTGKRVIIQNKKGDTYTVKDIKGNESTTTIDEIENCYDSKSKQIACPMIMELGNPARKTRKTRKRQIR